MEGHTSAIISYVLFCAENVSESRTVKAFPNQKSTMAAVASSRWMLQTGGG